MALRRGLRRRFKRRPLRSGRKYTRRIRKRKSFPKRVYRRKRARFSVEAKDVNIGGAYNLRGVDSNFWLTSNIHCLTPRTGSLVIAQGVTNGTRIGNKISFKKAVIRGCLTPLQYDAVANPNPRPLIVKAYLCALKQNQGNTSQEIADVWTTKAFDYGVNGNLGLSGSLIDHVLPFNKEVLVIKASKTFRLGRASYIAITTPGPEAYSYYSNNDFKSYRNFVWDVTKYLPRDYHFDDNNAPNTATGRHYYIVFTLTPADGSTVNAEDQMVQLTYRFDVEYYDV